MKKSFVSLLLLTFGAIQTWAQCAMCKASVESNLPEAAANRANGLNTGILYMMIIPYVLFGVIAFLWYRSSRKETAAQNKLESILRRTLGNFKTAR